MQQRRDASFYLCGEVSRYIYQLCFRTYTSESVPLPSAWFLLLSSRVGDGTFMAAEEFLRVQVRMMNKMASASKRKAEGVHSGKRTELALIQKTADTIKSEFIQDGQPYIQFVISEALRQTELSSNIVKGLAAIDPSTMLKGPTEVALRRFDVLFSTFQRRSWVSPANKSACRDYYVELLDYLRSIYSANFDVTEAAEDFINFLMSLEFLQTKEHLLYLFLLCCLCITTASPSHPGVVVGSIDTSGHRGRFTDVILQVQSYLSGVSGSVTFCENDVNLANCSLLSASFGRIAFSPSYDPWETVDVFRRTKNFKLLLSTYRSVRSGLKSSSFSTYRC